MATASVLAKSLMSVMLVRLAFKIPVGWKSVKGNSYYAGETHGALAETHPVKKENKKECYLKLKDSLLNITQAHTN